MIRSEYLASTCPTGIEPPGEAASSTSFGLRPAFPNPFQVSTTIEYTLPDAEFVRIEVYDVLGRLVSILVEAEMTAGAHQIAWDGYSQAGRRFTPGLYLVRLQAGVLHAQTGLLLLE